MRILVSEPCLVFTIQFIQCLALPLTLISISHAKSYVWPRTGHATDSVVSPTVDWITFGRVHTVLGGLASFTSTWAHNKGLSIETIWESWGKCFTCYMPPWHLINQSTNAEQTASKAIKEKITYLRMQMANASFDSDSTAASTFLRCQRAWRASLMSSRRRSRNSLINFSARLKASLSVPWRGYT